MKAEELIDFIRMEYKWDVIESIPEFSSLKECNQNPKWHAEGNAWNHTINVCDEAIKMCKEGHYDMSDVKILLTAALFHDIGKNKTTFCGKDGNWHSYGHEEVGETMTATILDGENDEFVHKVSSLVRWHMYPLSIFTHRDCLERITSVSRKVASWALLLDLKTCDLEGSVQEDSNRKNFDRMVLRELRRIVKEMGCLYTPSSIPNRNNFIYNSEFKY